MRREWIGRYRRSGNSVAVAVPLELRNLLGWPVGSYLVMTVHEGLLLIRRVDHTMVVEREHGPAGGQRG
jgi:antitoxin component of MazEF toxin-antitoxin module